MSKSTNIAIIPAIKSIMKGRIANIMIKLVLAMLISYVIYNQIFARENIKELTDAFTARWTIEFIPWLAMAIILMPINWIFETLKWRVLIKQFDKNSFWQHYKAIFAGISFSIFTPNRIGEYGGRILLVDAKNNWKAVVATLVGSFSQLLILLSFGVLGFIYFISQFTNTEAYLIWSSTLLVIGIVGLLYFCFFNIDLTIPIIQRLARTERLRKYTHHFEVLRNYSKYELSLALRYALLRYFVYAFQYYLILRFFGIEVSLLTGLSGIATIFLLQTSIPLSPILGLFVRGEIALFVWGYFCSNQLNILASTFSLWVLNLIIPALIGVLFIVNINVLKSLGYENEHR